MVCFLAPMAAAITMSVIRRTAKTLAKRLMLWILDILLWSGVILLAVEHAWHGEIVPWPPFLTSVADPASISVMLHEILVVGVPMTASVFAVWGLIFGLSKLLATKPVETRLTIPNQYPRAR